MTPRDGRRHRRADGRGVITAAHAQNPIILFPCWMAGR